MKLERNRAERRCKTGVQIVFAGVPFLIFAAIAAGFLAGAPKLVAVSSISQAAKSTVTIVERKTLPFMVAAYIGKTNSVISTGFTENDFTYTGSKTWLDDGNGNWRLKLLTSGTFTPSKNVTIDLFLVGGGGGGGTTNTSRLGGGGAGGYTVTHLNIALSPGVSYSITIGGGGAVGAAGGITSIVGTGINYSANGGGAGGTGVTGSPYTADGGNGGSGGGCGKNDGTNKNGGSDGSKGGAGSVNDGTGQGTTTREFGEAGGDLYAAGGGGGTWDSTAGLGGAGGGGNGSKNSVATAGQANTGSGGGGRGSAAGAAGGSGIAIIRNHR